jgi:DNA polymerase-1
MKFTPSTESDTNGFLSHEEFLSRLDNVTPTAQGHKAKCPLHDSKSGANLSITEKDGKTLTHCFAEECSFEDILNALKARKYTKEEVYSRRGFEWKDLAGNVVAYHRHRGPWFRPLPDGTWIGKQPADLPLYNLPEVLKAVGSGKPVYVVEGEPDVESLREIGITATTSGGADTWRPEYRIFFAGAMVVQLYDNDDAGKRYAAKVYQSLSPVAASIKVVTLPRVEHKEDVTDWLNLRGGTPDELREIVDCTLHSQFPFPKYVVGNGNEGVIALSRYPRPTGRQPFLIEKVAPEGFPTVFYGDSGTLKTTIAAHLGLSVAAGRDAWLGFPINKQASVLIIDFELDRDTMLRKLYDLAAGMGFAGLPEDTYYISGAGKTTKETFEAALRFVEEHGIGLVVIDSLGIAMDGDMDSAKTVVKFMHEVMDEFRAMGATSVLVDHQGKLQMGEHYQSKTQYGNSFKKHLIRSQFQIEAKDGGITIRHKKTNFGPLLDPFGAEITFEDEKITVSRMDLTQAELAEEATVNLKKRILIALEDGPEFTDALAERLNAEHKSVSNRVAELVEAEKVEYTGRTENRYREVRLKRQIHVHSQNTTDPKGMGIGNEGNVDGNAEKSHSTDPVPNPGNEAGNGVVQPVLEDVVTTPERAEACIAWLKSIPSVALDIETYGKTKDDATSYLRGTVRLLTFHSGGQTWVVDLHAVADELAAEMLRSIDDKPKYLHNALFDLTRLYRRTGVLLKDNVYDTLLASRTARAGEWTGHGTKKSHELGPVLERELGIEVDKDIDHKWGEPLTSERLDYAVNDVLHLEELHQVLQRLLERHGVAERYEAVRATLPTFLEAAVRGVPVDKERLEELSATALAERERLREILDEMAPEHPEADEGEAWTWNTNKNDESKGRKNRGRNGALRALERVGVKIDNLQDQTLLDRRDDHPLVGALQAYRKKSQEYSKYRRWLPDFYEAGRIFPQPKVAGAVTSRLLYADPNIQGVEKHKTKEYRKVVSPGAGMSLITGDFAQQELRIAALVSGDKGMLRTFAGGEDIYSKTAEKMVGRPVDKSDPARAGAKRATLGFLYGLGIDKYRENTYKDYNIALSKEQAKKDREAFRAAFPEFYKWQQEHGSRKEWETRSILGWRRVVGPGESKNGEREPKYTDRLNGPIQSTAGDILYLTLAKMQEDWAAGIRTDARFLAGVHDEIVVECPEESAEEVARWLKEKMREAFEEVLTPELGGPESVEVSYGPSWGEQKRLEDPDEKG